MLRSADKDRGRTISPKSMKPTGNENLPPWWVSLIPFVVLVAVLFLVVKIFGSDSLEGGSQVALLIAAAVAAGISILAYKKPWDELEEAILDNVRSIGTAIIILILIGAVSGTWMCSGVVPTLIYYGMKIITPGVFLFLTCIVCAAVSVMTGSSWTTIATIGVALTGIGTALGYSPGWTAGAIISGAYFGDKISPLSDTTVLASSSAGTPLFDHIRYMMITTVPSFTIACIIFLIVSLCHGKADAAQAAEFTTALEATYNLSPWLLIVPVLTIVLIAKRVPALLTLFLAALMACIASLIAQPQIISEVATGIEGGSPAGLSFIDGFKGAFITVYGSTSVQTGSEALDALVSTRGMIGMLSTIFLILCAVTFGGVMNGSGMLRSITEIITRRIRRTTSLVSATVGTGVFCNMVTGDQYLSIIMAAQLYRKAYDEQGCESRLLSRSVEDSATVTSVLIPWNSCGMTQATVLKISTFEYLPYCLFNIISPFMSIFIAATGYKIFRKTKS